MIESLTKESTTKESTIGTSAAFQDLVVGALETVLGQTLRSVSYWILDSDQAEFSQEQPNNSGLLWVSLRFPQNAVAITFGWEKRLRGEDLAYHVQVTSTETPDAAEAGAVGNARELAEVSTAPWGEAIGKRLNEVEVLGLQGSPQAVRLSFSGTDIVAAVGYAGKADLIVGDGDEVLIFSEHGWHVQKSGYGLEWESLWSGTK